MYLNIWGKSIKVCMICVFVLLLMCVVHDEIYHVTNICACPFFYNDVCTRNSGWGRHLKQTWACFTIMEPFWQAQRNGLVSHLGKVKWSDPYTLLSLRKTGQYVLMDLGWMQFETCFHCLEQHQRRPDDLCYLSTVRWRSLRRGCPDLA